MFFDIGVTIFGTLIWVNPILIYTTVKLTSKPSCVYLTYPLQMMAQKLYVLILFYLKMYVYLMYVLTWHVPFKLQINVSWLHNKMQIKTHKGTQTKTQHTHAKIHTQFLFSYDFLQLKQYKYNLILWLTNSKSVLHETLRNFVSSVEETKQYFLLGVYFLKTKKFIRRFYFFIT